MDFELCYTAALLTTSTFPVATWRLSRKVPGWFTQSKVSKGIDSLGFNSTVGIEFSVTSQGNSWPSFVGQPQIWMGHPAQMCLFRKTLAAFEQQCLSGTRTEPLGQHSCAPIELENKCRFRGTITLLFPEWQTSRDFLSFSTNKNFWYRLVPGNSNNLSLLLSVPWQTIPWIAVTELLV